MFGWRVICVIKGIEPFRRWFIPRSLIRRPRSDSYGNAPRISPLLQQTGHGKKGKPSTSLASHGRSRKLSDGVPRFVEAEIRVGGYAAEVRGAGAWI